MCCADHMPLQRSHVAPYFFYIVTRAHDCYTREFVGSVRCVEGTAHDASHILGGLVSETATHFVQANERGIAHPKYTWIFLDEVSQCPLKLLPLLQNYQILGVRFVFGGGYDQQLPTGEAWGEAVSRKPERRAATPVLCGGLLIESGT